MLGASKRGMQVKLDASQTEWHRLVGSSSTSFCLYNEKWCALAPTASRMLLTIHAMLTRWSPINCTLSYLSLSWRPKQFHNETVPAISANWIHLNRANAKFVATSGCSRQIEGQHSHGRASKFGCLNVRCHPAVHRALRLKWRSTSCSRFFALATRVYRGLVT